MKSFSLYLFACLTFLLTGSSPSPSGYHICLNTFASTKKIKTMTYRMEKQERIDGKMKNQISDTKLLRSPYSVYLKQKAPNNGLEVLYVQNKNGNKAIINPNGFPWVNLNMSPTGSIMRKEQHHTLLDSGFDLVISILEHLFDKYGANTESMVFLDGTSEYNGHECWVITFKNPNYKLINHTVKSSETVISIAEKYHISEYSILELNKSLSDYDDAKEGQVIKIPNDYSPKMTIYIDKKRNIPLVVKVYDHVGLFEYYKYSDVMLNPSFSSDEFSKDNDQYNF